MILIKYAFQKYLSCVLEYIRKYGLHYFMCSRLRDEILSLHTSDTIQRQKCTNVLYSYNSTRNFFVTMYQDLDWLISFLSVLISGEIIALILWKTFERSLGMIIWSNLKCHFKKNFFLKCPSSVWILMQQQHAYCSYDQT